MKKLIILVLCIIFGVVGSACSDSDGSITSDILEASPPSVSVTPETVKPTNELPVETATPEVSEFGPDDWGMLGVRLGDSLETVIAVLGEPESQDTTYSLSNEDNITTYTYEFGRVSLISYGVVDIIIDTPGYAGCRGIQVGDDLQSVLDKFPGMMPDEVHLAMGGSIYIYGDADSSNHAYLSQDVTGSLIGVSFICGERDGINLNPHVGLKVGIENDYVVEIRILIPL